MINFFISSSVHSHASNLSRKFLKKAILALLSYSKRCKSQYLKKVVFFHSSSLDVLISIKKGRKDICSSPSNVSAIILLNSGDIMTVSHSSTSSICSEKVLKSSEETSISQGVYVKYFASTPSSSASNQISICLMTFDLITSV